MSNDLPVVLVHGMFGFGPEELGHLSYWGSALEAPSPLTRIEAGVGPISSPHDRACELAAQLKGVRVDYGKVHADAHGHKRFGRDYRDQALWPDWNEHHPLHMVGHSLGAATIRALQSLLASDYWGWGSSDRWIASVSSISGSLNGTTAVYYFGIDSKTGLIPRGAGITPLLRLLELYTADNTSILDSFLDFDLDHWGFVRGADENIIDYLQRVRESQFFWGADNAFHSVSLQGAYRDNMRWSTYRHTYYFAYVTENSFRLLPGGHYYPSPLMTAAFQPASWYVGRKKFKEAPIPVKDFRSSAWWENDGLVPTFSQTAPHISGRHTTGGMITRKTGTGELLPGRWYTQWERGFDHAGIVSAIRSYQRGRRERFYTALFERLASLPLS